MKSVAIPLLVLALGSCKVPSATFLQLGDHVYSARPEGHPIAVFEFEEDVPHPFVKIGRVTGKLVDHNRFGATAMSSVEDVIEAMKSTARAAGADALVLRSGLDSRSSSTRGKQYGSTRTESSVRFSPSILGLSGHTATAIRYGETRK